MRTPSSRTASRDLVARPLLFALSVLCGAVGGVLVSLAVPGAAHGATGTAGAAGPAGDAGGDVAPDAAIDAPSRPRADGAPRVVPAPLPVPAPPDSAPAPFEAATWDRTVARVADSVVSLELSQLRAFDDAPQGISTATGFVVDAERGIVLTNRHVVGSGPIRVSATFQNQERVDAVPLYRDPIHDFAFVRYDPASLVYARPDSLALRPDKVRTGMNIRVIGSDGGEQLSILPGTIARLDREVPSYGRYGYNDFNTFYLQAASGTSGGSSGSPVIDLAGDVVALNAAANRNTASSFFLPLERVARALERLRVGTDVPRGGLQTVFGHRPFRELARLGLDAASEARARADDPATTGMLTVEQVIPGGAADGALEAGDVLVAVAGETVTGFEELEALLDARVGEPVALEIVRGGRPSELEARVADLHALEPKRFVELGDAVLQDMSIQHARAMNLPARGVVVAEPGYFFTRAGVPEGAVVRRVAGRAVDGLDDLLDALGEVPAGAKATVRFVVPGRERTEEAARLEIDDAWFDHRECERVDDARFWRCAPIEPGGGPAAGGAPGEASGDASDAARPAAPAGAADVAPARASDAGPAPGVAEPRTGAALDASLRTLPASASGPAPGPASGTAPAAAFVPSYADPTLDRVAPALVKVDFHIPYATDDVYARHFAGVGLVLDGDAGLVAVDRNTVPVALGDAEITFFGSTVVDADVAYLHPRHNVALLRYDPADLGGATFEALELAAPDAPMPAAPIMIGYRDDGTLRARRTAEPSRLTIDFAPPGLPRFQQSPLDAYGVEGVPPSLGGPIVAADGTVHALYMSFAHESDREIRQSELAMPAAVLAEALRQYREGEPYRSLDVHLGYRPLALARELGLPDAWLARYLALGAEARRALYVERVVPGTDAATKLAAGDVLLAVDGRLVSDLLVAERLAQRGRTVLSVLRDGEVVDVELFPSAIPAAGTGRIVSWAGASFQAPHPDIAWHKGVAFPGVYVADTAAGSPALWDGLWRNRFVTAVDGVPVAGLDDFLDAVGGVDGRGDGAVDGAVDGAGGDATVRLSTTSMDGRRSIVAVRPEHRFWPTFEVVRTAAGWRRVGHPN